MKISVNPDLIEIIDLPRNEPDHESHDRENNDVCCVCNTVVLKPASTAQCMPMKFFEIFWIFIFIIYLFFFPKFFFWIFYYHSSLCLHSFYGNSRLLLSECFSLFIKFVFAAIFIRASYERSIPVGIVYFLAMNRSMDSVGNWLSESLVSGRWYREVSLRFLVRHEIGISVFPVRGDWNDNIAYIHLYCVS